jgi:hypothetical protein
MAFDWEWIENNLKQMHPVDRRQVEARFRERYGQSLSQESFNALPNRLQFAHAAGFAQLAMVGPGPPC